MDIVIPVKRAILNEELKYTLRAICENVPHSRVWLSGYKPMFVSDQAGEVSVSVPFGNKYVKTANNILSACKYDEVSEDFLLFNDDIFVMKPITDFKNMHRGSVTDRIEELLSKDGKVSNAYFDGLQRTYNILRRMGFDNPMDYGLHIPMLVSKKKWREAWVAQREHNPKGKPLHLRTFYGNFHNVGGEQMNDPKIADFDVRPTGEETFLSTNDDSFAQGLIGEYIRSRFPNLCKYENGFKSVMLQ